MADTKISALTIDSTPDRVADYLASYDASAVATKRVLMSLVGAFSLPMVYWHNLSPADSTTYTLSPWNTYALATVMAGHKVRIPRTGKVLAVYIDGIVGTTLATTEDSTMSFRLNDTTDTTISSAVKFSASPFSFSNTALSIAVTAGDYFNIKITTPAFATNPVGVYITAHVFMA